MGMKALTASEVHAQAVSALGLDPSAIDLTAIEAIAAAIRRVASLRCPCPERSLINAVLTPLDGLVEEKDKVQQIVEETLESLISYGDLLENHAMPNDESHQGGTLIYIAPPSFVFRKSGSALLIGMAPDNISPLPEELEKKVEYVNHVRCLTAGPVEELKPYLLQLGFVELSQRAWLKEPAHESPAHHLRRLNDKLDHSGRSGEITGLTILDPSTPVRYYPARWKPATIQSGRFVARRNQAYGADLWCYVELESGRPTKLLDFPFPNSKLRGCDEAWRLQAAIDACRNEPQRFRIREGPNRTQVIEFFAPVPMWAKRRWDSVGEPVLGMGCLFSYQFSANEIEEELNFFSDTLWLAKVAEAGEK